MKYVTINCKKGPIYKPEDLEGLEADTLFFVHWHWKIPKEIYEKYNCIGFHSTDLPYGRGGSPIKNLLKRGFDKTKITAFKIVEEMDAGPMYLKKDLSLDGTEAEILERAYKIIDKMIEEIIETEPAPVEQGECTEYFKRL